MKRLVYLISTFLILTGYSSVVSPQQWTRLDETGNSISEFHERYRDQYLDLSSQPGVKSSLATSPNGCWAAFAQYFSTQQTVKALALHKCKTYCSATCTIVDINGKSAFIKQRGSSGSTTTASGFSSTASSSGKVWCATSNSVVNVSRSQCKTWNGNAFSLEYQAEAEHKRLKAAYQLAKKKAEAEAATSVVDKSVELEFWKTIKDSDDPDMFREYLRQFPDGVYAGLAKLKVKKLGGKTTSVAQSSIPNLDYGNYYALVIGNNRYEHLSDLRTAVNDATKVASVLKRDYGFEVDLLTNATESQIVKSLRNYRRNLSENDNLLIYYAGHGGFDEDANRTGYWLPVDATRDDPSNWIMTDYVVNQITAMEAKHVMVVADSCFSGAIGRGIKIDYGSPNWVHKLVKKKARIRLTSGGLEPVADGVGSHSLFAKIFISLLEENTEVLNTSKLFNDLQRRFPTSAQNPEYGDLHEAGDDGGDFLFVRQ